MICVDILNLVNIFNINVQFYASFLSSHLRLISILSLAMFILMSIAPSMISYLVFASTATNDTSGFFESNGDPVKLASN